MSESIHHLAAFTTTPTGGNPAGIWIGETLPDVHTMQQIAARIGFSDTAFVAPPTGFDRIVRYYSPTAEVPFCGHATIATGVLLGEQCGAGRYQFATAVGQIPVDVSVNDGHWEASLTSVPPQQKSVSDMLLQEALEALNWTYDDLDLTISPVQAYAGAWHLVIAVNQRRTLDTLAYKFSVLRELMLREGLLTLQLVWKESDTVYYARNPFPIGGVIEDPATGSAAAALGGYLRDSGSINPPTQLIIHQGEVMGRPSRLLITIPVTGGIIVTGTAVHL